MNTARVGWLDCRMGASGDMLLGAFLSAGASLETVQTAVGALGVGVRVERDEVTRAGLAAVAAVVAADEADPPHRTWSDVRALLETAALATEVRRSALEVFAVLARAEGAVHAIAPEQVHFHEVGALDALADVVGVCAARHALGIGRLLAGPVALGAGQVDTAHGSLPVPAPAVVEIARTHAIPTRGGPVELELCTPTGAALLAVLVDEWGPLPDGTITAVGTGAGGREVPGRANAVRLLVVEPAPAEPAIDGGALVLETNVDDLDPRLWPSVLGALLAAGASDAWLTPILMKKGRPAHTLSVLVPAASAAAAREVVYTQTSAIGLREHAVDKRALERTTASVEVAGQQVRVKLALLDGRVVNAQPEYDDLVAAAAAAALPLKRVLALAVAASRELLG